MFGSIQIIDPASVPAYPYSPRMLRTFLAAILGTISIGIIGVITLDLFRNKITTSSQLHRLVGTGFLGATSDDSLARRPWWNPLRFFSRSVEQEIADLRATLSAHGLFDEPDIFVAGFTGSKEANLTLARLRPAFAGNDFSVTGPDNVLGEESEDMPLSNELPKLTLLPALNDRFRWRSVSALPRSVLVISVPAGIISPERILQVREQAAEYSGLRLFFFFVDWHTGQRRAALSPAV